MTSKARLVLVLLLSLLVPAVSRAAGPAEPSPVLAAPLSSKASENSACAEQDVVAQILGGESAQAAAGLADTPFARRQEKTDSCYQWECEEFCNNVCYECGGYPASQCTRSFNGTCRSICYCYSC